MERFSMDSEAFAKLRLDFDKLLSQTIRSMMQKQSSSASLGLKLDIELERTTVIDNRAPDGVRSVILPRFTHKVSSVIQMKTEEKGKTEGAYELSWDDLRQEYTMLPIGNEQITFEQYGG